MRPDYPAAIWYPAHPTNVLRPPENRPKGWVLHTPEEPADGYAGTPVWFATPNVGGSTHYFVSYLGFVFQCVEENVGAIANGVTPDKPYPAWANSNITLNRQSLSVEIEGYAATIGNTISPAQKTALLRLLDYGCAKYSIPCDRAHIIGHYQVASNRSDPGTLDIDALVAELQEEDMPLTNEDLLKIRQIVAEEVVGIVARAGSDGQPSLKDIITETQKTLALTEDIHFRAGAAGNPTLKDIISEVQKGD